MYMLEGVWKNRLEIQSTIKMQSLILRNMVFQIKSESKRRSILPRMKKNIEAFDLTLDFISDRKIQPLFYFVPILPNKAFPYVEKEFSLWKSNLSDLINNKNFDVFDYTELIDQKYWGTNFGKDIDFMHFGGNGHHILAKKVFKALQISK